MKCKGLKSRIRNNKLTIGTWLTIGHTSVVEVLAQAGFDWIAIDVEHNLINPDMLRQLIITGQSKGVSMFVRIVKNDEVYLKYALDAGADGIICPMVNSIDDTENLISYSYYPPKGKRGVGLSRAQDYGNKFKDYMNWVEKELVIIGQIEHINAINNIDQITCVEEIDAFMIGPYDLSASLGVPGQFDQENVKKAIEKFNKTCKRNNKSSGIHIVPIEEDRLKKAIDQDYKFIAFGTDFNFMKSNFEIVRNIKWQKNF